jgi:hypothetical protein
MTALERQHHEALAEMLEATLPIQTLATFTFPGQLATTTQLCDTAFTEFMRGMRANTRQSVGYIRSDEDTGRNHIHVALVAAHPINEAVVSNTWQSVVGMSPSACVAQTFSPGMGGIAYLLKDGTYTLSHDIHLFDRNTDPASLPSNERRTFSRIWKEE